ncbi:MAG: DUF3566 domain-containing protein [Actinomycetota bacterium]|nr:DUF3566 domain-containing protein [Actinomycetota bacterium]
MTERRTDETSIAPRRSLSGNPASNSEPPVLPPPVQQPARKPGWLAQRAKQKEERAAAKEAAGRTRPDRPPTATLAEAAGTGSAAAGASSASKPAARASGQPRGPSSQASSKPSSRGKSGAVRRPPRKARLRVVQIDAWSVMKTAFLLSVAIGIVTVVAVGIVWSVLSAAGVWNSINSVVQTAVGGDTGSKFEVQKYVGTSRVLGFTMIIAVVDVVLITAIATLGAFVYNLAATLIGGIELTLAEDD